MRARRLSAAVLLLAAACGKATPEGEPAGKRVEPAPEPPPPPRPTTPPPPLADLAEDPGGDGEPRWGLSIGGLAEDVAWEVAALPDGGAVVCGHVTGDTSFPAPLGARTAENGDAYVMGIGAGGAPAWVHLVSGPNDDTCDGLAVGDGLVVAGGLFSKTMKLGALSAKSHGADDLWVAAFRADTGAPAWLFTAGGRSSDSVLALAAAPAGGFVAAGGFFDRMQVGAHPLAAAGYEDAFLIKLSADGEVEWARRYGGDQPERFVAVAVDVQGSIYALAAFRSKSTYGAHTLESAGGYDFALIKLDPVGEVVWARRFGGMDNDNGLGLAVDPSGHVTVVGSFDRSIVIGDTTHRAAGASDVVIARFAPDGTPAWSRTFGGKGEDIGTAIAADAAGNVVVTGWFEHEVDFGKGAVRAAGNKDAFVLKLDRAGATRWVRTWGDRDHDKGRAIAVTAAGDVHVVGIYRFRLALPTPLESTHAPGDRAPKTDAFLIHVSR